MAEERGPSASPVCYAREAGIDPAYMWANAGGCGRVRLCPAADPLHFGFGVYVARAAAYSPTAVLAELLDALGG